MEDVTTLDLSVGSGAAAVAATTLTIIIPTLNERDNVWPLLELLAKALAELAWEVILVDDDSRDGTAAYVRSVARRDPRVRCIQRIGRRGLTTACIEGGLGSASPYVAIMDADLTHDERLLPQMLQLLSSGKFDLVVGSRYIAGGDVGDWDGSRTRISSLAPRLRGFVAKLM